MTYRGKKLTLKNCPFCGEAPKATEHKTSGKPVLLISCANDYCGAVTEVAHPPDEAIAFWNTRRALSHYEVEIQ